MRPHQVKVIWIDTPQKKLIWEARHKLDFSTENFFYEAYCYGREDPKVRAKRAEDIQKMFIEYLHSGGEDVPEPVLDYALDVMAGRVNPYHNE